VTTQPDQDTPEPQWLPLADAAARVHRSVRQLRRLVVEGTVQAEKHGAGQGARWMVNVAALDAHYETVTIRSHTEQPPTGGPLVPAGEWAAILAAYAERAGRAEVRAEMLQEEVDRLHLELAQERGQVRAAPTTTEEPTTEEPRRWWRRARP
jgi:hypothetical protein